MRNIKLVTVGDSTVGKTCLLITFTSNKFPSYVPSVCDDYTADLTVGGKSVHLELCDTATSEDLERLRPLLSYPNTDVFLLCYSVISSYSLSNILVKWVPEIQHYAPGVPTLLVGLKSDLKESAEEREMVVTLEDAEKVRDCIGAVGSVQCSALTQEGLKVVFDEAIRAALNVEKQKKKQKKSKCCLL